MNKHILCTVYVPFINRMYHGDEPFTIPGMQENSWAVEQSNFEIYFQIFSPAGLERQIGFQALHGSLSSPSFLKGAV